MPRVAIVGAGISGLATAYFLQQHGIASVLIEKSNRLGGLVKTDFLEGCRLEAGPDSYIAAKPAATRLAGKLEIPVIGSNDAARRIFIFRSGQLVPLPTGMVLMVPREWKPVLRSKLFSAGAKLRLLAETRMSPRERNNDVSVGEFVTDHFGTELLESVTEPLLSGVYGGSAAELSAQSVLPRFVEYERQQGSLIRAVRQSKTEAPSGSLFLSLRDGMQSLIDVLGDEFTGEQVSGKASEIRREASGSWQVRVGVDWITADHLVLACPAYECARLLHVVHPTLSTELGAIPYSSAILATFVYDASQVADALNGFGLLVPERERKTVAAATFVHVKFPSRIASGSAAVRAFIVGRQAEELLTASDEQIRQFSEQDLARLLGIHSQPRFTTLYRWPRSMPQYVVGHERRRLNIEAYVNELAGLHLVGNAYEGVGIPDCVRLADEAAQDIAALGKIKSL